MSNEMDGTGSMVVEQSAAESDAAREAKQQEIKVKLKLAQAAKDALEKDMDGKVYACKIEDALTALMDFIDNDAQWSFMEALGIAEVSKALLACARKDTKSGVIYLKSLEVDAIHYFLSKHSGKGIETAQEFLKLIRPLNETIRLVKADRDNMQKLTQQVSAYENGIDIEMPEEEIKQEESNDTGAAE